MEDCRYNRSSFFLRKSAVDSRVTLVCFGASPSVRQSLQHFIGNGPHEVASIAPLLLFEVTLQGLFRDIDDSVWNLSDAFGPLEYVSPKHQMMKIITILILFLIENPA